jgi:hypothetical protein
MELSHDSDLFAILKMLGTFGKHTNLVAAYTELFGLRPLKSKTKKWRILLEEMKRLFDSESFSFQKRTYRISQAGIVEALNLVVHRNFTDGLDSHNYLKKIMITVAEKEERESEKQGERDLRKKETGLMSGSRRINGDTLRQDAPIYPVPVEQLGAPSMKTMPQARLTDAEIEANRKRLKDLIKGIGDK